MVAISQLWYNGSYTIAAKPIKTLESHYTMIQFLIKAYNLLHEEETRKKSELQIFSEFPLDAKTSCCCISTKKGSLGGITYSSENVGDEIIRRRSVRPKHVHS